MGIAVAHFERSTKRKRRINYVYFSTIYFIVLRECAASSIPIKVASRNNIIINRLCVMYMCCAIKMLPFHRNNYKVNFNMCSAVSNIGKYILF